MAEVSLSRICSFVTFAGGMLMIVIGLYVFIMSSFGAVFVTGENIFGGLITIICGGVALVGWNKIGGMIWPISLSWPER